MELPDPMKVMSPIFDLEVDDSIDPKSKEMIVSCLQELMNELAFGPKYKEIIGEV